MNKKKSKVLAFLLATAMLVPSANGIVSAEEVVNKPTNIEENQIAESTVNVSTEDEFLKYAEDESISIINVISDISFTNKGENEGKVLDISNKTINLCGNEIKSYHFNIIFEGNNFTIQNGKIGSNNKSDYPLFIGENPTDNVLLKNIAVDGGINIYDSQNVVLEDVDVTATRYYAVWCDEGANVTIKSGIFKVNPDAEVKGNALIGMTKKGTSLIIEDGEFLSGDRNLVLENKDEFNKPIVKGGKFDCSAKEYIDKSLKVEVVSDGMHSYYPTVSDALDKAPTGSDIIDLENPPAEGTTPIEVELSDKNGTGKEFELVADKDGNVKLPSMSRSGYNFKGWRDSNTGKIYNVDDVLNIKDNPDLVLEAVWEKVQTPSVPSKPIHPTYDHTSIIGSDRYDTAAKIADKLGSYDTAVLVNATSTMSDGLSAAGLAGKEDAAILLVKKDSIPKATMDRLKKVRKVYIIGGENAISQKVVNEITKNVAKVEVERLGGKTRVETSELVAKEIGNYKKAFVVNGFKGEADAMSASSVAAREEAPILLTNGKTSTHAKKSDVKYYVVGGKNVMNNAIADKYNAEIIAGDDRYETNREMVNEFYGASETLYFANGETLVDALTASTIAKDDGLVLVGRKSDNKILNRKNTIQVGGMNFDVDFEK